MKKYSYLEISNFGENLKTLRKGLRLSQDALAKKIEIVTHQDISDYETGRRLPSDEVVMAAARVLSVTPEVLLSEPGLEDTSSQIMTLMKQFCRLSQKLNEYEANTLDKRMLCAQPLHDFRCYVHHPAAELMTWRQLGLPLGVC